MVSWLRVPVEEKNKPKLNWLSSMGYYAAVGKLQDEADEERMDLANDFLSTLLKATLSTDSQISFFAIKTIATLVRVGHATSGILAIDGLPLLFECMVTHQGTSKETFVFEIMYALTNDRESRSKLWCHWPASSVKSMVRTRSIECDPLSCYTKRFGWRLKPSTTPGTKSTSSRRSVLTKRRYRLIRPSERTIRCTAPSSTQNRRYASSRFTHWLTS